MVAADVLPPFVFFDGVHHGFVEQVAVKLLLYQVIEGPAAEDAPGQAFAAAAGYQHHAQGVGRGQPPKLRQQHQPVGVGQVVVEQHTVGLLLAKQGEALLTGGRFHHFQPLEARARGQVVLVQQPVAGVVIDEQAALHKKREMGNLEAPSQ